MNLEEMRAELLEMLQALEDQLRSSQVQDFFRAKDLQTRETFVGRRGQISGLIDELRIAELRDIEADLNRFAPDIQAGIGDLQRDIERLEDSITMLNTMSRIVNLVTRVVAFV
jgi:archaellum component FlaC